MIEEPEEPEEASIEPKPCKIEIRANELNQLLGYYHLFIVFTDSSGVEYYFRGGPSAEGPGGSSGLSSELSGGSSHSSSAGSSDASTSGNSGSGSNPSASSDSGGGGPWGDIVTVYGLYEPDTIDWDPSAKSVEIASGVDACSKFEALQRQMDLITASHTRYNPLGPNSNSVVFTAIRNVGLTPQEPAGVWAPGARTHIDVPPETP